MARIREGLDVAVVRDGDGRHSPGIGAFYYVFALRDTVHITHFGVAVQLDPLDGCIIDSRSDKGRNLHDALDGRDDHFLVKSIHDCRAPYLDKGSFSEIL